MPLVFKKTSAKSDLADAQPSREKRNGHAKARDMSEAGLKNPNTRVRVGHAIKLLGISSSSIYKWMQTGRLPRFDGKDTRSYWMSATFLKIIEDQKKSNYLMGGKLGDV